MDHSLLLPTADSLEPEPRRRALPFLKILTLASWSGKAQISRRRLRSRTSARKSILLLFLSLSFFLCALWTFSPPVRRLYRDIKELLVGPIGDWDLNTPPRYQDVIALQQSLPQHNLNLSYPEGAMGRFVKFSCQLTTAGWNNYLSEALLLSHLAYRSNRAYVFRDLIWEVKHYPWSWTKVWHVHPRTPLPALITGPTAGGAWEQGDSSPRAVHEDFWNIVCPKDKVRIIATQDIKLEYGITWASAKRIFNIWRDILLEETASCVEVVNRAQGARFDWHGQLFGLWLWGSPDRLLDIWEEFKGSPVSRLLATSPIVQRGVERNMLLFGLRGTGHSESKTSVESRHWDHVMAVHIRRGDFGRHCKKLANWRSAFFGWNSLPELPDRIEDPDSPEYRPGRNTPENVLIYMKHCLPDTDTIISKITSARNEYEETIFGSRQIRQNISTLYILNNEHSSAWLNEMRRRLEGEPGWTVVSSQDIVFGDAQEKDVSMEIDMEVARRAAIFIGNGWSSYTSNIVHRRLVDGREPISIRFF